MVLIELLLLGDWVVTGVGTPNQVAFRLLMVAAGLLVIVLALAVRGRKR
jgi:hypothetical protein